MISARLALLPKKTREAQARGFFIAHGVPVQNPKTTLAGLAGALFAAWQPFLTQGRAPSGAELGFAAMVAILGWVAGDAR